MGWGLLSAVSERAQSFLTFLCSTRVPVFFFAPTRSISHRRAQSVSRWPSRHLAACLWVLPGHNLDSFEQAGTLGAVGMTIRGAPAFLCADNARHDLYRWVET